MMGHTDRDTINDRKPLTKGMYALLKQIVRNGSVAYDECANGERNQLRALMDRGLALPVGDGAKWEATPEGQAAVDGTKT